ncbi:MAG: outer membrane lipid asymmetry maintenance protein MlaD [Maricaulaceae bacterium]|jgi:phospholipid/cholesterol/gamma-HCH transport system substrate-binding protein
MRDQAAEMLVGAVVLAIAALFLTYSLSATNRTGAGYELFVRFGSADGLATGADVRVSGVKVGSVSGINLDEQTFDARVRFTVADAVEIPTDSSVSLKNEGLLGGVYLAIEPGGAEDVFNEGDEMLYGQGSIDVVRLLADFVTSAGDQ